ncbi:uncharacterized protein GGS25DRAFT_479751 [Hypoxylon fragiforme]|uniref:uncharacterized protein n=1 Tax=Hypoxylon fragiforme TaxID=63214 RepID=UPI0020C6FA4B|nr:uncharacterized protein GGS25DRAFT_479751 [Hypoxylon fragiforme]KAI2610764.1 hypothetical protein GGS25DRAFT_479751 [Hypoxylon fragiforme]
MPGRGPIPFLFLLLGAPNYPAVVQNSNMNIPQHVFHHAIDLDEQHSNLLGPSSLNNEAFQVRDLKRRLGLINTTAW